MSKKNFIFLIIFLIVFGFLILNFRKAEVVEAATTGTGPNSPTCDTTYCANGTKPSGGVSWLTPTNIATSDNAYAYKSLTSLAYTFYLKATNFGFSIPTGSTINGIVVDIERKASSTASILDNGVYIIQGDTITGTDHKDGVNTWPNADTYKTYGTSTDLWDTTWTVANINGTDFGVAISAINTHEVSSRTASINHIQITVYYTPPSITVSGNAKAYDQSTNLTSGTVRIAVNSSLQAQTGTISAGEWSVTIAMPVPGARITVWINGVNPGDVPDTNEAVAVTKYDGSGDITGMNLYERHLSIGSGDNQTITNADLSNYDYSASGDEDIFYDVDTSNNLILPAGGTSTYTDQELIIQVYNTYRPDSATPRTVTTPNLEIPANAILTADSNTIILSGFGTPFPLGGTFNYDTSTVRYTYYGATGTNITATTYNNLELRPAGAGTNSYTLGTEASQTINTNGYLTIGDGLNAVTVDHDNLDSILDVNGNFTISAAATFLASGTANFTVAGNWLRVGTFTHNNGTVIFDDNTKTSNISGSNTFWNLTSNTLSKRIVFPAGVEQTVRNLTLNGQDCNTEIILRSSTTGSQWLLKVTNEVKVFYVDVQDSNATGNPIVAYNSIDSGGNDSLLPPPSWAIYSGQCRNLFGWAWSENIGWISFNSKNCDIDDDGVMDRENVGPGTGDAVAPAQCPPDEKEIPKYGVGLPLGVETGGPHPFSGYAWSDKIGWIRFKPQNPSAPSIIGYFDTNPASILNKEAYGWIRACGGTASPDTSCDGGVNPTAGGWDGWIHLLRDPYAPVGPDYQVWLDTTSVSPPEFRNWAWGSDVVGWISFNCSNQGVCTDDTDEGGPSNYKVTYEVQNQPPTASNLSESLNYCNISPGTGLVSFSWTYQDGEAQNQSQYQIEVRKTDETKFVHVQCINGNAIDQWVPSGQTGTSAVKIVDSPTPALCDIPSFVGDIPYNDSFEWRVRVSDSTGQWSSWSAWKLFNNPVEIHAYPWSDFTLDPQYPDANMSVNFYDDPSQVYGGTTKASWYWQFPSDASLTSSTAEDPTGIRFQTAGPNVVKLTLEDSDGAATPDPNDFKCTKSKSVPVGLPLPEWKEILPTF